MIYTVTLNPSIDYTVHLDNFRTGALNRMEESHKLPGGKGINVSRVLKRIGQPTVALGFLGGFTGDFIMDCLKQEEITCSFTRIKEDTRINVKIKSSTETEINGAGPVIAPEEIQDLKEKLMKITDRDIVVLSGSAPKNLGTGFYQELIEIIKKKKAGFIIDTTGEDLLESLPSHPFLIKPNHLELAELLSADICGIDQIVEQGSKLKDAGAENVLISMGEDGAILITDAGVYRAEGLKGTLLNSVGAGDSMIAGFIGEYKKSGDLLEAFKWGIACGSGTAFSVDLASSEIIRKLLQEVEIKQL